MAAGKGVLICFSAMEVEQDCVCVCVFFFFLNLLLSHNLAEILKFCPFHSDKI